MSEIGSQTWRTVTLGQLAKKLVNGGTPPTEVARFWKGNIPWVTGADFTPSGLGEFRRFVSEEAVAQTSTNVIQKGQLLVVTRTGVGKLAIAPCDIAISQDITGIYVDDRQAEPAFLFHRMRQGVGELKKLNQGTSINGIIRSDLISYRVELPSIPEQRGIAEILSTLDKTIEQTEALIAKYQQIKDGLMHDLFTRGVTPDGHLRPSDESQLTRFGMIPKGWKIGSLLDVADPTRQPILTGPFGADLGNDDFVTEGVPVLRIGNVQQGRLDLSDLLFVTEAKARELERYKVNEDDLLFARQGATTGRNALATKDVQGFLINYHIIRVALDHSRCAPLFVEAAFAGDIVKRQIERDKGRGTREGMNTAQLKVLQVPLASVDEQRTIAEILKAHTSQLEETQKQSAKLQSLKMGLMHDLLTGRVGVKVE